MTAPQQTADLAAVLADDALLDVLGGRATELADALASDELSVLLAAWRRGVDARPVGDLVDTGRAVAVLAAARIAENDLFAHATEETTRVQ